MARRAGAFSHSAQVLVESRHIGRHIGQAKHHAVVLYGMVCRPHHAIAVAAAVADDLDGQLVESNVIADLLKWSGIAKRRNAVGPDFEALVR